MLRADRFCYAQARLQSRHGQRPGSEVWQQLESVGDLSGYLSMARRTSLSQWVSGINTIQDIHVIELFLRQQFRDYVDEIAGWLPGEWSASIKWIKRVPDLPALQHLLDGYTAPHWLLNDPELKMLGSEQKELRMGTFMESDCAPLVEHWQHGMPLPRAWLEHWLALVPAHAQNDEGIRKLTRIFQVSCSTVDVQPVTDTRVQRQVLEERLASLFRSYSFRSAATFAHLGLIALDIARLRQAICRRLLFPEILKAAT